MKTKNLFPVLFFLVFGWITFGADVNAQTSESGIASPGLPSASAASYYYISKPGELTIQINIWGSVRNPGRYEVPSSTDLVQLVSYAGGPNTDAKLNNVQIIRIARDGTSTKREQLLINLEELDRIDPTKLVLHPGDTIFIDHTGWTTVRDVLTLVTTAAIITSAIASLIIAEQRLR